MATQKGRNWSSGDIVTAANLGSIERGVSAVAEEYTPTTWANGNTVTATGLNNIEQGIVNAGGGSSDFSTAEVTINVNLPEGETVGTIEASIGFGSMAQQMMYTGTAVADANKISIAMYKGSGYIESIHVQTSESNYTFKSNFTTASGDVVWDSNVGFYGGWKVTGDGSLTTTLPYPDDDDEG